MLERAIARQSLPDYCARLDPTYISTPHTRMLCDRLEALERRDIRRLMVTLPPRHSKSYHSSERFPAWYLGRRPKERVILASYAGDLAERNSRTVRNLIADERSPFDVQVSPESRAVGRWDTNEGGMLLAAGVGGGITGFGADLLNIDDPVANREQADSANFRERVWEWYQEVARTRLMPDAVELLTLTRWHEDDLAGRILQTAASSDWEVLNLPALAEVDDPLGRVPGEALWPDRFPATSLPSVLKGEISARAFAALYQQRPSPAEGGMFKAEWLVRRYTQEQLAAVAKGPRWRVVQAIDTATREGVGVDFSVVATWGTDGISYYLLDVWRKRVDYPELRRMAEELYWKWKPRIVLVEDTTHGRPLMQDLKMRSPIPLFPVKPVGSKETRADAVTPLFATGHVVLPAYASWLDEWTNEHLAFPQSTHDDQVDTTSMALQELRSIGVRLPKLTIFGKPLSKVAV